MPEPGALDERWAQGTTWRFRVQGYNPENDALADFSVWQDFWCTFKTSHDDTDAEALFQLNYPTEIQVVPGDTSTIEVTIAATLTAGAAWLGRTTRGYLDVKGRDNTGKPWMLARGRGTVMAAGTRTT